MLSFRGSILLIDRLFSSISRIILFFSSRPLILSTSSFADLLFIEKAIIIALRFILKFVLYAGLSINGMYLFDVL